MKSSVQDEVIRDALSARSSGGEIVRRAALELANQRPVLDGERQRERRS